VSVAFFLAVAFLVAVLVIAEFVWLREEAEEKARSLTKDDIESRPAPRAHSATFKPQWISTTSATASERSA
jgi:hypothetical protein